MNKKSVLITGASYGIGAATALAFAKAGYDIVLNYHKNKVDAEKAAEACHAAGAKVWLVQADVADPQSVQRLRADVQKHVGKLDVLINNAAFIGEPDFAKATKEDMLQSLSVNLVAAMLMVQAFVPDVMKQKASVLSVTSMYGLRYSGSPGLPIYSASKAAMINFMETMAKVYAPSVRFNLVAPGYTDTPAWDDTPAARKQEVIATTPLNEWVTAEEIADTLLFLANTPHINAETIVVDSGWSLRKNA